MEPFSKLLLFARFWVACISLAAFSAWAGESPSLSRAPIHRFSFDGTGGSGAELVDSIGSTHGEIHIVQPPRLPYHKGSTTWVVLPDTEGYCMKRPQVFWSMMDWVAKNRVERRIECVLHVGDITNNNLDAEWVNARKAFDYIEGKIPYVLTAGNHDYDHTDGRLTHMNKYFKHSDLAKWKTFGGAFEPGKLENHYQLMEINGQEWMVLSLEMGPRKDVIAWANSLLAKHGERLAIILTHGFLYYGNERYDHRRGKQRASPYAFYGEGADGEMLWSQLVSKHRNVMMVVCGHLSSQYVGYRKDRGDHGNVVHQMLVDYEKLRGGGGGFLRLLEFLPDGRTVQVRTYSPVSKQIRSPVTKGDKPIQEASLEEFVFTLQTAPGHEDALAVSPKTGPSTDSAAGRRAPEKRLEHLRLNGRGQLVFSSSESKGHGRLDASLVEGRKRVSVEVWVTPTARSYNWSSVFHFKGGKNDHFYYKYRTYGRHRAELIDGGHNEKVQCDVAAPAGERVHIVVTYDEEGRDGRPLLSSYFNGRLTGTLQTGIKLSELALTGGQVGPFAGAFDELRIYDYPLNASEVKGNFEAGPSKVSIAK